MKNPASQGNNPKRSDLATNQDHNGREPCPTNQDWVLLLEDALDVTQREFLEQHLGECPECEKRFDQLTSNQDLDSWCELLASWDADTEDGQLAFREATRPSIPGYEVENELGRGGMGVVYRARHLSLDRYVAIKTLLPGTVASPERFARFEVEAKAIARLRHPGIVQIHDVGMAGGAPYLTLDLMDGCSLNDLIGEPGHSYEMEWSPRQCGQIVESLAKTIHYVHQQGIVHRDLKPSNILLETAGPNAQEIVELDGRKIDIANPRITDFGLAKHALVDSETKTGELLGTAHYISPENAAGDPDWSSPANDIYALGVILYQLLTSRVPFHGETVAATLRMISSVEAIPPRQHRSSVPYDLQTICLKCLEKRPANRYATAKDLAEDLHRFKEHLPVKARPVSRIERAGRWFRRHPMVAMLASLLFVTALGSVLVIAKQMQTTTQAVDAQRTAEQRADEMESEVSLGHYVRKIAEVTHALMAADFRKTEQTLQECATTRRSWEWHLLRQLSIKGFKELRPLHSEVAVTCVEVTADGRYYAAGDAHGNLEIRAQDHSRLHRLRISNDNQAVRNLQFCQIASTGERMCLASTDTVLAAIALSSGNILRFENLSMAPGESIVDFTIVPQSEDVFICSTLGKVWRNKIVSAESLASIDLNRDDVRGLGVAPNKDELTILTSELLQIELDLQSLKLVREIPFEAKTSIEESDTKSTVKRFHLNRKGNFLAIVYQGDTRFEIVDSLTTRRMRRLIGHAGDILDVAFSPDDQLVATSDNSGLVKVWATRKEYGKRSPLRLRHAGAVRALSWLNNDEILVGDDQGRLQRYAISDSSAMSIVDVATCHVDSDHESVIRALVVDPTGSWIATASDDGRVIVRNATTLKRIQELERHPDRVRGLALMNDARVIVTACNDGYLRWFDSLTYKKIGELRCFDGNCSALDVDPITDQIAVAGSRHNRLHLFESLRPDAKPSRRIPDIFERTVRDISFHPAGFEFVASGGPEVHVVTRSQEIFDLPGHEGRSTYCRYSPDGNWIVTLSTDGSATRVWNAKTHEQHYVLADRFPLGITRNSRRLIVRKNGQGKNNSSNAIEFIDVESRFTVWEPPIRNTSLTRLESSQDGRLMFGIDSNRKLLRWSIED